jgi:hypothetical protein
MAAKAARLAQPAAHWFTPVAPASVAARGASVKPAVLLRPTAPATRYTGSLSAPVT